MRLFLFLALSILSSCGSWRHACLIEPPVQALAQKEASINQDPLFDLQAPLPEQWWLIFNDPQLSCLIETALARNPTFALALANVRLAEANLGRVRSTLFPYVWWGGDVSRQKLSTTGVFPFSDIDFPIGPRIPEYFTLYETQLNLTYNFDLWGKNRNAFRAALSEAQAARADALFSRLQVGTSVAKVYFQLQTGYKRKAIAESLLKSSQEYSAFVQARTEKGLEDDRATNTSISNTSKIRENLYLVEQEIVISENLLKSYLAGNFEEEICPVALDSLPVVPLPCDLPLSLLARRPDITAQLWLIEARDRQMAATKAAFYPDFNLLAFFGFQTIHFRELFKWPSSYFNVDPAFTLPLFDAGLRLANYRGSEVTYDKAILHYNELVLAAAKETLTGISSLHYLNLQLKEAETNYENEKKNLDLVCLRVQNSLDSKLRYLEQEEKMWQAYEEETLVLGRTYQAIVELIQAIGGGY